MEFSGTGRDTNSLTVGKMPNRQINIYEKKKEILSSNKHYWWELWGLKEEDYKNKEIWRVEVRAGKKEIDKWSAKTYESFEQKFGDIVKSCLLYTSPSPRDAQ